MLSLASYIDSRAGLEGRYIDGVVHPFDRILAAIREHAPRTLTVCLSAITANYEAAIRIAKAIKSIDAQISIVIRNDRFSALSREILEHRVGLIDRTLPHTSIYTENFTKRLGHRILELTGRRVRKGVPVEIGRGCIKFSGDDACSFCSIRYGSLWKNELPADEAWEAIRQAYLAQGKRRDLHRLFNGGARCNHQRRHRIAVA
nr:cobalamin-dependent protein [Trinickia dinghuensis]